MSAWSYEYDSLTREIHHHHSKIKFVSAREHMISSCAMRNTFIVIKVKTFFTLSVPMPSSQVRRKI